MSAITQAITPTDLLYGFQVFDAAGIPRSRMRFAYMEQEDCWCLRDSEGDVVKASRQADGSWVEAS